MNRFELLWRGYQSRSLTAAEVHEFLDLLDTHDFSRKIDQLLHDGQEGLSLPGEKALIFEQVRLKLHSSAIIRPAMHRVHFLKTVRLAGRRQWLRYPTSLFDSRSLAKAVKLRWASAAAIIILFGMGAYLWNKNSTNKNTADVSAEARSAKEDVAPGGNKAILTLADGTSIILDSAANGKLAQQGNTTVTKQNDQIIYGIPSREGPLREAKRGVGLAPQTFNTMTTPRGGQYQLILPDGSKVWLNAASSITYPTAFTGKERNVKITGEVYFEVARDKSKPFFVTCSLLRLPEQSEGRAGGGQVIEVLGTHFNINAYTDEPATTTTLLEGSVKINERLLKPGEAYVHGKVVTADVEQAVAWKNGVFNFKGAGIEEAIRQIARWYDVDVVYDHGIPQGNFGGEMGRSLTLRQVLKGLEGISAHFRLEGETLHVLPLSKK